MHSRENIICEKATHPGNFERKIGSKLFSDEDLKRYVLEPDRVDRNTRTVYPDSHYYQLRIQKFKFNAFSSRLNLKTCLLF